MPDDQDRNGLPPLPDPDPAWLEERIRAGEVPDQVVPKRKPGRPKGSKQDILTSHHAEEILRTRTSRYEKAGGRNGGNKTSTFKHKKIDDKLSETDWQKTYAAFAKTGDVKAIAAETGLETIEVRHLLELGIVRLGLRPIYEQAVDYEQVNQRAEGLLTALVQQGALPGAAAQPGALVRHLPDAEQAVTDRAIRETVASQAVLQACTHSTDVLLGYVQKLLQRIADPEGGYVMPEKVGPAQIIALAKATSALAAANEKAIQQSRLAAGEPTQNIAIHVASFVAQLTPEERRHFIMTKELPSHLRNRGGSRDSVTGPSAQDVIEAKVVEKKDA